MHGFNGADALQPIAGQPGGSLIVELLDCSKHTEGFVIKTLGQTLQHQVSQTTDIPPQRDVVLQAAGGDGEPGRRGGNGQNGREGTPGTDATKWQDATVS